MTVRIYTDPDHSVKHTVATTVGLATVMSAPAVAAAVISEPAAVADTAGLTSLHEIAVANVKAAAKATVLSESTWQKIEGWVKLEVNRIEGQLTLMLHDASTGFEAEKIKVVAEYQKLISGFSWFKTHWKSLTATHGVAAAVGVAVKWFLL